jgi:hypothetical protein
VKGVRHLSIEIGPRCNLSAEHTSCPAHGRVIDREMLSVERITEVIRAALALGFEGYVGFHFYNEPTLYAERMAAVMDAVPEARFMLWTNNATYTEPRIKWYERSDYSNPDYAFDKRLDNYGTPIRGGACYRPFIECSIDYSGRISLCCQDWLLTALDLDVSQMDATEALVAWRREACSVACGVCPPVCRSCHGANSERQWRHALEAVGMCP